MNGTTGDILTRWLAGLPASGWTGTTTTLRANLASVAQPGDTIPGPRSTARTLEERLLAETRFQLRRRRMTKARLLIVEPTSAEAAA